MKGFRPNSKYAHEEIKKAALRAVSTEARGFLLAGFLGGLCGGVVGAIFCFGVGAFFY